MEVLQLWQQRRFIEIDVGRILEMAESCFGEGERLYCLVFLKTAQCAHRRAYLDQGANSQTLS